VNLVSAAPEHINPSAEASGTPEIMSTVIGPYSITFCALADLPLFL
jgi:hypothetical protein